MMGDMYKKNTCLDFPKGGNEALVGALVRGVEKHGGAKFQKLPHDEDRLRGGYGVLESLIEIRRPLAEAG